MLKKVQFVTRKVKGGLAAAAVVVGVGATNANAALDLTGFTLNTADVETIMATVILGLAALWGYRKIVKSMNRS